MSEIKLFRQSEEGIAEITGTTVSREKHLQRKFEDNLDSILGVHFLASEYFTTDGRIDTLGIDNKNRPVIIEYKRNRNDNVINQGLDYLSWLMDHKGDFKVLVQDKLGKARSIDWSDPLLICVASDFTRRDKNAVKEMKRNIELIRYRKFGDDLLMLEFLSEPTRNKSTFAVKAVVPMGKAVNDAKISEVGGMKKELYEELTNYLFSLGDDVQELRKKKYVAFKRNKTFAYVRLRNQKKRILVAVLINPDEIDLVKDFSRDASKDHLGCCNFELTIDSYEKLEWAKPFIKQSYDVL